MARSAIDPRMPPPAVLPAQARNDFTGGRVSNANACTLWSTVRSVDGFRCEDGVDALLMKHLETVGGGQFKLLESGAANYCNYLVRLDDGEAAIE